VACDSTSKVCKEAFIWNSPIARLDVFRLTVDIRPKNALQLIGNELGADDRRAQQTGARVATEGERLCSD
jgi:hypothetical protein